MSLLSATCQNLCNSSVNLCSGFTVVAGLIRVDFDIAGEITVQHMTNMGTQWDSASVTDGGGAACGSVWKGCLT
jgi:hypothetical protein